MTLSKMRLVQLGGIAVFLIAVSLLVASFSGQVKVTVTPSDAKADGGGGVQHISGLFMPDESSQAPKLGGSSAPSLVNGCLDLGSTQACFYGSAWSVASTSCSFKLPSASSTLMLAVAQIRNQQGTANFGEWGWSKDLMSTSTSLGSGALSSTVNTVLMASSTGGYSQINPATILPPGGYLTFKQGSTTPTGVTGRCSAEVVTI